MSIGLSPYQTADYRVPVHQPIRYDTRDYNILVKEEEEFTLAYRKEIQQLIRENQSTDLKIEQNLPLPLETLEKIEKLIKKLRIIDKTYHLELLQDEIYGFFVQVMVPLNARDALKLWLDLAPLSRETGIPIAVKWAGENNVPRKEILKNLGEIMAKMGVFLRAEKPIDSVKLIREMRD